MNKGTFTIEYNGKIETFDNIIVDNGKDELLNIDFTEKYTQGYRFIDVTNMNIDSIELNLETKKITFNG